MNRKWACHSAASLQRRKVPNRRKQNSESIAATTKHHNNLLQQIDNFQPDESPCILQQLLNQPPNRTSTHKPRLNLKVDVEGLKEERYKLKRENVQLQKQLELTRLQIVSQNCQIKRLKEFETYFEEAANDSMKNAPQNSYKPTKHESLMIVNQRKQINSLKSSLLEKDLEITRLRKVPANNALLEIEVERQELIEETIRLKAYIRSRVDSTTEQPLEMVDELLKLLREENQKLKGSLRLCQHEKAIVRAKRSILKKQKESLERQLKEAIEKLAEKTSQVELLNHENKNLLLRKINQLKLMQEEKDREEIERLHNQMDLLTSNKRSVQNSNTALRDELVTLKEKYKQSVQNECQLQENYDAMTKHYQQQLEQSQEELKNFKDNYFKAALSNFQTSKDRWSIKVRRQSRTNLSIEPESSVQSKFTRPVRVGELRAEILQMKVCMIKNKLRYGDLFIQEFYTEHQFFELFAHSPFYLSGESIARLVRYMYDDSSDLIDGQRVQSRKVLEVYLKTIVPHCQLIYQKRRQFLEEWNQTIKLYGERLIRSISDLARRQKYARFEELEQIFKGLGIRKSQEELDLLASEIYEGEFDEEGRFEVDRLMEFLQKTLRKNSELSVEEF